MTTLVLATASSYKQRQFQQLNLPYTCDAADINEVVKQQESAYAASKRLAQAKAKHVALRHPHALIIGCDQCAELDGTIIGKPHTKNNAIAQLQRYSGRKIQFHSGLALLEASTLREWSCVTTTEVTFRTLTTREITDYIEADQPLDCAGSFKAESLGIGLFESIKSDDPSALIGLPLIALCAMLRKAGLNPLHSLPI